MLSPFNNEETKIASILSQVLLYFEWQGQILPTETSAKIELKECHKSQAKYKGVDSFI